MLAYAPVAHLLLQRGEIVLALLGFIGVYLVEPLPDKDFRIPFLRHRGTSHSLFSALVVGIVLGAVGWVTGKQLPLLSAETLAGFGFAVGVVGILTHLLGDIITESGIQPFLPISKWRVSLSPVNADSTIANSALFGLGILALVVVLLAAVPVGWQAIQPQLPHLPLDSERMRFQNFIAVVSSIEDTSQY